MVVSVDRQAKPGPPKTSIITWTLVMFAALGLAVAGGILYRPLHLRYACWRLRGDPAYTESFLSHGQDAVRCLEALPAQEGRVLLTLKGTCAQRGTIAPGAPEGYVHLSAGPQTEVIIAFRLNRISQIRFLEQDQ